MSRSRLEELDQTNSHRVPILGILGSDRATVDALFAEKRKEVRHIDLR